MARNIISRIKSFINKELRLDHYIKDINLNLGCGNKRMEGFINIDYYNTAYADLIYDLNRGLPYDNSSVDLIYSDNFMEHLEDVVGMVRDCYRVLKKGGHLIVKVPYFKSKHAFIDPTHKVFFTLQSMDYYVSGKYSHREYRFFEEAFDNIRIYMDDKNKNIVKKIIERYAIKHPGKFENSILSSIFVYHNIIYVLRK